MEDASYLTEINEDLKQKYSYLIVRIGEKISFNGGSENEKILRNFRDTEKTVPGMGWTNISTGMMKFW